MNEVLLKTVILKEACFFKNASLYADVGDLQLCVDLILKVLDKERREDGLVLQVLHLIKRI